eukprot:362010-Chlamydomonas_euryale.AAC.5
MTPAPPSAETRLRPTGLLRRAAHAGARTAVAAAVAPVPGAALVALGTVRPRGIGISMGSRGSVGSMGSMDTCSVGGGGLRPPGRRNVSNVGGPTAAAAAAVPPTVVGAARTRACMRAGRRRRLAAAAALTRALRRRRAQDRPDWRASPQRGGRAGEAGQTGRRQLNPRRHGLPRRSCPAWSGQSARRHLEHRRRVRGKKAEAVNHALTAHGCAPEARHPAARAPQLVWGGRPAI